jgi:hypothetical protein
MSGGPLAAELWSRFMSDSDFDAVTSASNRWMQAWMEQDRTMLDAFLGPDFALVVSTVPTKPFGRSDWLDTAITSYVCTRFAYEGVQCRHISFDVIAMSAIADFDATIGGIDRSGRYFVTDLWHRVAGSTHGWQVDARYSSRPGEPDASVRALLER